MSPMQPVRGTKDFFGQDAEHFRHIVQLALSLGKCYGYLEVMTPIFESANVFLRTLGETSDVVSKEMYVFEDKGGDLMALRPEGTAGVVRAFLSNGLTQNLPQKLFYAGPMFRYERPQKGRMRQFHQIGAEVIGEASPFVDAEVIAFGHHLLRQLDIMDGVTLKLNTLGDAQSREGFRNALVAYFQSVEQKLSPESRLRLQKNPLRILDSKDEGDRELLKEAPRREAYLTPVAKEYFDGVCSSLAAIGILYEIDPFLVRGLDYYSHTAFEFVSSNLGAQSAVLAGGRYDGLIETMGGGATPAVGWAAGIERIMLLSSFVPKDVLDVAIIPISEDQMEAAFVMATHLRHADVSVGLEFQGNVSKRMKKAAKQNVHNVWLIGEEEIQTNHVTWKNMESGEQISLPFAEAMAKMQKFKEKKVFKE
ncbi:MAG: histidine--tRNA ligase [Alphaproteobacteria bacterium]|nr:histidine--tRNA ligase [Alphaproteobacteria bacterium]OJV47149.1 MAG: histidine--tRNA ligase [Alphaproteobacteria bacterium 43-37]